MSELENQIIPPPIGGEPIIEPSGEVIPPPIGNGSNDDIPTIDVADMFNTDTGMISEEKAAQNYLRINPNMYVYFDMEMTGLSMDADIISIGLCDSHGNSFYAEFNDINYGNCSTWVFENVMRKLVHPQNHLEGDHWTMTGNRKEISMNLGIWLDEIHTKYNTGIQFVADVGHYDFVLLISLMWGNAMRVPEWICPALCDLNQDLANLSAAQYDGTGNKEGNPVDFNPYFHAFNLSREEYKEHISNAPQGLQHNAMYDAYLVRAIHQSLYNYGS